MAYVHGFEALQVDAPRLCLYEWERDSDPDKTPHVCNLDRGHSSNRHYCYCGAGMTVLDNVKLHSISIGLEGNPITIMKEKQ